MVEDRAALRLLTDSEQVEDVLAVLQVVPKITYRDLLLAIASTYASRMETPGDYLNSDVVNLPSEGGQVMVSYSPPGTPGSSKFHEAWIDTYDREIFVFRQSEGDPRARVRAYRFDGDRDAHDWVAIPQERRRKMVNSLLFHSMVNPPQPQSLVGGLETAGLTVGKELY